MFVFVQIYQIRQIKSKKGINKLQTIKAFQKECRIKIRMQQLTGAKEYPILNVSVLFDDKQFSQSDIASDISALTLTLTVNGPLSCS